MDADKLLLGLIGQENNVTLFNTVYTILVVALAFVVGWIVQWIIVGLFRRFGDRLHNDMYMDLRNARFFPRPPE